MKCEPDAAPPPEFKWYFTPKNGAESEITIGQDGYRILSDGTLVIDKVTKQDAGQYRCWAKNFLDSAQATAGATVLSKNMLRRINTTICWPNLSGTTNLEANWYLYSAGTAHAFFKVKTFYKTFWKTLCSNRLVCFQFKYYK